MKFFMGKSFPLRYTFTPRVEAATSKALFDKRATVSLSKDVICKSIKVGNQAHRVDMDGAYFEFWQIR